MSTYIGEIIEVRVNGEWKLLETFYDADYHKTTPDIKLPDVDLYKSDEKVIISESYATIFDNRWLEFLLNNMNNDLGLPSDVSDKAKTKYESMPNSPSIPSYFTFDELNKAYKCVKDEMFVKMEQDIHTNFESSVLEKLEYVCDKLDNPNIKRRKLNVKKDTNNYWQFTYYENIEMLEMLNEQMSRIHTTVENGCSLLLKYSDIRIIWFVL